MTIGYIESILLYPGAVPFQVKIDTGAKTSSIDVRDPVVFERESREWVRFNIKNKNGDSISIERPVVRKPKVRRSGTAKQVRYVVKLGVCLGEHFKEAEVNLNDRTGMSYKMLIGRLFLSDRFLVDSSKKNLTKPNCPEAPQR
ncbi:MAG: RimK/LysX family protein [Proteobacteria bacterium]|nr:RimK/LysX family protein [Pseudomonadota bacterium]MDA1023911.1 RimK/LysX family protein [Pseudomonadota bacterium]